MSPRRPALRDLAAGFVLWALAFATLYAMLSLGCRLGWHDVEVASGISLQRLQLSVLVLVFLATQAGLLLRLRSTAANADATAGFLSAAGRCAAAAAIGASLFTFSGIAGLSACT
ncbi:MAG: hypothetical protein AB7K86_09935 [Rhodospirillales bacterium]